MIQLVCRSESGRPAQEGADTRFVLEKAATGPKRDTTGRGDITELEVAVALMRSGRRVLRPISAGLRYDLVIDEGDGTFARVQCKTGRLRSGVISFRLAMCDARRPSGVPYHGEIEAFGVHCPELGRSYLVPMADLGPLRNLACLRLAPARNGQRRRIRSAAEYEIGRRLDSGVLSPS